MDTGEFKEQAILSISESSSAEDGAIIVIFGIGERNERSKTP
ncbi:hypothetical protein SDC9_143161 [bioreactor metagenome]|uniref:Uncharacterized protein n=1 Tax=bioreactor metagenome TaxID=1076179 RepID=A0A645E398_9ZZZZ